MMKFLLLSLVLLASAVKEEAATNFSDEELMEGIATEDDDSTIDDLGSTASDEDTFIDLDALWTDLMEDAGDQDDSNAGEIEIEDIEVLIEELEETLEDMEDFETVTIDGVEYTKDELEAYIDSLYEDIEELELSDALIDLEVLIMYAPDPGNLEDFNDGMAAADLLIQEMQDNNVDTIILTEVEYTVQEVLQLIEDAEDSMEDVVMDLEAADMEGLEVGTTEDSIETYLEELQQVLDSMEGIGDKVTIDGVVYMEEDLQVVYDEVALLLDDLDEGNDINDEIQDVEDQLAKVDVTYDDYEDEIEEIEEVIDIMTEPVLINGELYDLQALSDLIQAAEAGMQDLDVLAQIDVINEILEENIEEQRLSYEMYLAGIDAVEVLIEIMEPDDIAFLDGDEYTDVELQELVDMSVLYNGLQHINAAVVEAEDNDFSDPPTSDELEIEIELYETILGFMAPGSSVTIDGVSYTSAELEAYKEELQDLLEETLNTESLENELVDVQTYLDIIDGTATTEELEVLIVEIEELEADMEDGDLISTSGGELLDASDIGEIADDTQEILDGLDEGESYTFGSSDSVADLIGAFLP